MYLGNHCVLHVMDSKARLSAGIICDDTSLSHAIYALQSGWLTPLWTPKSIRGDDAFNHTQFIEFVKAIGSNFEPIPPRCHSKNVLESRHGILRPIFLRLRQGDGAVNERVHISMASDVSNQLYGSYIMSAYELAHGFLKPLSDYPTQLPDELLQAHNTLEAKWKLAPILRSKSPDNSAVSPGDMVEIYIKQPNHKLGSWSALHVVFYTDLETCSITFPVSCGRNVKAAFEDTRPAIADECFAQTVREANDVFDRAIDLELDRLQMTEANYECSPHDEANSPTETKHVEQVNTSQRDYPSTLQSTNTAFDPVCATDGSSLPIDCTYVAPLSVKAPTEISHNPKIGDKIEVFWPLDNEYFPGVIAEEQNGSQTVVYDDGGIETLDFGRETWCYASSAKLLSICASSIKLNSDAPMVLSSMFNFFGNKPFLRHQAQAFPAYILLNAYMTEECDFRKVVKETPLVEIPHKSNIIASHTIYKIKVNDDQSLKRKARIAPHGNEGSLRFSLRSDCSMCPPTGFRIITSTASLKRWRITDIDVKPPSCKQDKLLEMFMLLHLPKAPTATSISGFFSQPPMDLSMPMPMPSGRLSLTKYCMIWVSYLLLYFSSSSTSKTSLK